MIDLTLLGTSPPSSAMNQTTQILSPGELIRTSGKFTKPTKIPGKNYSKDEVVIRNADSGKGIFYLLLLFALKMYRSIHQQLDSLHTKTY